LNLFFIATSELWKKVSLIVCPLALIGSAGNAMMIMKQHQAHAHEHSHHEIDHPPFSYQKIRSKVFDIF
jgi:hypothetical protein